MKIKAEHWVNYNGRWYRPGEEYETEPVKEPAAEEKKATQEQPVKRGRKRKTEE